MPPITYTNPFSRVPLGQRRRVSAHTANYTIRNEESGTHFTNEGAGALVAFTLPTSPATGFWCTIFNAENQDVNVIAPADTLIAFNDVAADNIAFNTTNEKVGGGLLITTDGTKYHALVYLGMDTQTPVIGT